jgi:hypothetical protein
MCKANTNNTATGNKTESESKKKRNTIGVQGHSKSQQTREENSINHPGTKSALS